jgi:hypothetical protein
VPDPAAKSEPAKPEPAKAEPPKAETAKTEAPKTDAAKPAEPGKAAEAGKTEPPKAELPPGTVNLAINPWGEVFVNGRSRGVSPPMKNLKLPPGKYRIEIKNTTFPAYTENIEVKSREEITIRHKF